MDLLTYSGRVRINKYRKVENIAKINELTPYAADSIPNSGTIYLWRLLCNFLTSSGATSTGGSGSYELPKYLEMGYETGLTDNTIIHSTLVSSIQCSEAKVLNAESKIIEDGAKAAFVFSLFSANYRAPGNNNGLHFYLCSKPAHAFTDGITNGRQVDEDSILAKIDTGLSTYNILQDEVHIFQWELQFKNKTA